MRKRRKTAVLILALAVAVRACLPMPVYAKDNKNAPDQAGQTESYTVKKGDNLWKLSGEKYGRGILYQFIYEQNKGVIGENADLIFPGMVFQLPVIEAGKNGSDSAEKSGVTTADKSGGTTSEKSGVTTADKSGGTTSEKNVATTADKSGGTTPEKNVGTTAEKSGGTSTEKNGGSSADKSGDASAEKSTGRPEERIGAFFEAYYQALADGDAAYCEALYDSISEEDGKLLRAIAACIDRFENVRCRVLTGPVKDSYVVFVDYTASSEKNGITVDFAEAFYLYGAQAGKGFRIATDEQFFKDYKTGKK